MDVDFTEPRARMPYDGPPMPRVPPPDGVRQLRVSVWCGADGHPRDVLTANGSRVLDRFEEQWRCSACGTADIVVRWGDARRAHARRRELEREPTP